MPRYRQSERRWVQAALVAGAYLVCVALFFTLQLGAGLNLPISVAVSAPPLVYAALAMLLLRRDSFVRRLSWLGGACLVHVVLGALAAAELTLAGGLSLAAALAQVFVLFPPAPVLTLVATPLALAAFGLTAPRPRPRAEPVQARPAAATRQKPMTTSARGMKAEAAATASPAARVTPAAGATAAAATTAPTPQRPLVSPAPAVATAAVPVPSASAPVAVAVPAAPTPPVGAAAAAPAVATAAVPAVAAVPAPPTVSRAAKQARGGDDGMVRVPFERIAAQLPAEAFVLPFERLSESLREPHVILVPRRVVLSQMRDGAVAITWGHIASQFPDLALGMSDDEFRTQYPDLKLVLSIEELASQLPAGTVSAAAPESPPEWAKEPPVTPSVLSPASAPVQPPPPAVSQPAPAAPRPTPMPSVVSAPAPPVSVTPRAELVSRETLSRIVACFAGTGTFEASAERLGASTVVALVEPGLPRETATACAEQLLRFVAGAGDLMTVRTEHAVLIVAATALPIVVAARRPGAPVALLSLRARGAAGGDGMANVSPVPRRTLEPLAVDARVTQAALAVRSFGIEPTVFAEGAARVYVFSADSGDDKAVAEQALGLCDALRDGGPLGRLRSVVSSRGDVQMVVRPLAMGGALAISGRVTRPGRLLGDADRAAAVLEAR